MRLQDQKWRVLVSPVRLGGKEYRVIRPARSIRHAPMYEGCFGVDVYLDKAATVDLAFAWWLAARSRHSIVYLPLRTGGHTCDEFGRGDASPLDLVLSHHSLAFPASRWKEVRRRLSAGAPQTVRLPARVFPEPTPADYEKLRHREFRDHLRWDIAADTLVLTGSQTAFGLSGYRVRTLAEDGPAQLARYPDRHHCTEIDIGPRWRRYSSYRRRPSANLHLVCCQDHW